jgi:hypothetical protein
VAFAPLFDADKLFGQTFGSNVKVWYKTDSKGHSYRRGDLVTLVTYVTFYSPIELMLGDFFPFFYSEVTFVF